jgi:predicted transcriptional regulator of viral defense system
MSFIPNSLYICKKNGMNFIQFKNKLIDQKVFSIGDITKIWPDFNFTNLTTWQNKGYIIKIRNSWYSFPEILKSESDLYFLANVIKRPSYISLQTALRFYNFIPESVFSITSITTTKPVNYKVSVGNFEYRSIKPKMYFGYQVITNGRTFLMAEPEKTLLDMLYFNPKLTENLDFEGLRLNKVEISETIDLQRLNNYLKIIGSPSLEKRWKSLQIFLEL